MEGKTVASLVSFFGKIIWIFMLLKNQVWGYGSVGEHLLCLQKAPSLILGITSLKDQEQVM